MSNAGARLTLCAALWWSMPLLGGDWMQFRGPGGRGIADEAGLPVDLNAGEHLAWKLALPGRGLSSPIVVGERVIVTCSSGPRQERLHVFCFSTKDGRKLWERQFWATGRTMTQEKTCVAAPTPVSDGRRIFAMFSSGDVVCLDLDGNLLWVRGLTRDYPNASNSLGLASSPVVIGDTLIIQLETDSESFAAGLDSSTGLNRWKKDRPRLSNWTSPLLLTDGRSGQPVVALQSSAGIHALDPASGAELWSYQDGAATIPSSAALGDVLYVPSHGLTALKAPVSGATAEQLWRSGQLRPATSSPLARQNRIFLLNSAGILTSASVVAGERLWQLRLKGSFSSTPVAAGHHLYCVNEKGLIQVVDLDAPEGRVVGELDLGETILSTPAIAHAALYIRSDAHLWKLAHRPSSTPNSRPQ